MWTRDINSEVVNICIPYKITPLDKREQKGFEDLILGAPRLINQGHEECVGVQAKQTNVSFSKVGSDS